MKCTNIKNEKNVSTETNMKDNDNGNENLAKENVELIKLCTVEPDHNSNDAMQSQTPVNEVNDMIENVISSSLSLGTEVSQEDWQNETQDNGDNENNDNDGDNEKKKKNIDSIDSCSGNVVISSPLSSLSSLSLSSLSLPSSSSSSSSRRKRCRNKGLKKNHYTNHDTGKLKSVKKEHEENGDDDNVVKEKQKQ